MRYTPKGEGSLYVETSDYFSKFDMEKVKERMEELKNCEASIMTKELIERVQAVVAIIAVVITATVAASAASR